VAATLEKQQNRRWLTPGADYLFSEIRDADLPKNKTWKYGDKHPNSKLFPNHVLVMVGEEREIEGQGTVSQWYYAADRSNEDSYNWQVQGNDTLFRQYLVRRTEYPPTSYPTVGTADARFPQYVYAGESVAPAEGELNSIYVMVTRTYSIPTLITYQWDESISRTIKITRQIVPSGTVQGSSTSTGKIIEVQPGDAFYDLKITSEVLWNAADLSGGVPNFPIQLDSVGSDANYQFPPLLKSIKLFGAWAYATSDAPPSYSEDFFFETDITEPHPGPFEATVLRFLTPNPDAVRALYPTTRIVSRAETFGLVKAWAAASDDGNQSFALARQYNTPPTVHDVVDLPAQVNYTQGGGMAGTTLGKGSASLPATPNFAQFIASTTTIAGVDTKRSRLGLYEVQVVKIHAGGATIYGDTSNRIERPGTGSGVISPPGDLTVSVWISPGELLPAATVAFGRAIAAGATANISVWAIKSFDIEIDPAAASWISTTATLSQSAAWPTAHTIPITYAANATGVERTGTVRFVAVDGKFVTLTITQPAA